MKTPSVFRLVTGIDLCEEFNNYILLTVPTRFIRDWITSRYLDQILTAVKNHRKEIVRIEFKIDEIMAIKIILFTTISSLFKLNFLKTK